MVIDRIIGDLKKTKNWEEILKPPFFRYHVATSVEDAIHQLAENPGALILAGGQSLVPAMNFRLASPEMLIDIGKITGLSSILIEGDEVVVGANVRHRDLELSDEVFAELPVLRQALGNVAHVPIRHRGTIVGSICHADAAAEMPMMLTLTGGYVTAVGPEGTRKILAEDFFKFHMTTTRAADEMIVSAHFPIPPEGTGSHFREFARRNGDYMLAGTGALIRTDSGGRVVTARLAASGIASTPKRLLDVEHVLIGNILSERLLEKAASVAADAVSTPDDTSATNAYRRHLLTGLIKDVIAQAAKAEEGMVI